MNIREFDNLARFNAAVRADGRCEVCGGWTCNNEVLEDHHIISRRHLLTRWAQWNHIVAGRACHNAPAAIRAWIEVSRPKQWRWLRRAEMRLAKGGYKDRNMRPERIRARLKRPTKVLCGV